MHALAEAGEERQKNREFLEAASKDAPERRCVFCSAIRSDSRIRLLDTPQAFLTNFGLGNVLIAKGFGVACRLAIRLHQSSVFTRQT